MRGQDGIMMLPRTQQEINEISSLFPEKTIVYLQSDAAEGIIKNIQSPTILHIATHGYFLEDNIALAEGGKTHYVANLLLKAGLILAGAENFLTTGEAVNAAGNDGILTAYEAINLKLDNTDLVVLSACETR
jgi:CHAT domain-containing protein